MSEQFTFDLEVSVPLTLVAARIDLPKFNEEGVCPKCGSPSARVDYHRAIASYAPCGVYLQEVEQRGLEFPEHLDRTCDRCHYAWTEAVLNGHV
jgi:ribosomal protein S27AE